MRLIALLIALSAALPALAQPAAPPPPPAEDCGCGVPSSPRGPR